MVQTPASQQNQTLLLNFPSSIGLHVTQEQFAVLSAVNRDVKLEKTAQGELIVNPPTGWETGERNRSLTGQLYRWYEEKEDLGKAFDSSTGFILPNSINSSKVYILVCVWAWIIVSTSTSILTVPSLI